jgi:hypothetical protein
MTPDAARLQRRARELLPSEVYDYYARGSGRERTLRANKKAWRRVWMMPRVLRDVSAVDTTTRLLGTGLATPVGVAPTAFHRMAHAEGELATAAGAAAAGALYVLSSRSRRRIEDVGAVIAAGGGGWRVAAWSRQAYLGMVRVTRGLRRDRAHLVTEARRPMSEDIAYRQRRYLIMMGIRLVCFVIAVVLFTNGAGWLTAIPVVGAIIIPYFAVVFANGGREPTSRRGFQVYEPDLPERYSQPPGSSYQGTADAPAAGSHPPGENQT